MAEHLHQVDFWLQDPVAELAIECFFRANCADVGKQSLFVFIHTVDNAGRQNWDENR